jgi:hypothetical protein
LRCENTKSIFLKKNLFLKNQAGGGSGSGSGRMAFSTSGGRIETDAPVLSEMGGWTMLGVSVAVRGSGCAVVAVAGEIFFLPANGAVLRPGFCSPPPESSPRWRGGPVATA